jgi:hypothetical protein
MGCEAAGADSMVAGVAMRDILNFLEFCVANAAWE